MLMKSNFCVWYIYIYRHLKMTTNPSVDTNRSTIYSDLMPAYELLFPNCTLLRAQYLVQPPL